MSDDWLTELGGFLSTVPAGRGDARVALAVVAVSVLVLSRGGALRARSSFPRSSPSCRPISRRSSSPISSPRCCSSASSRFCARARCWCSRAAICSARFMAIAHALSFPGLFARADSSAGGPQTTAWLYFLWHGGFPLFVIGYALLRRPSGRASGARGRPARPSPCSVVRSSSRWRSLIVLLTTAGHDALPRS